MAFSVEEKHNLLSERQWLSGEVGTVLTWRLTPLPQIPSWQLLEHSSIARVPTVSLLSISAVSSLSLSYPRHSSAPMIYSYQSSSQAFLGCFFSFCMECHSVSALNGWLLTSYPAFWAQFTCHRLLLPLLYPWSGQLVDTPENQLRHHLPGEVCLTPPSPQERLVTFPPSVTSLFVHSDSFSRHWPFCMCWALWQAVGWQMSKTLSPCLSH